MMRLARVTGLLLGLLIGSGGGVLHGQIQGRGQCYWVVMADSARVSQHQMERTALNSLLAAHRAYPISVALWVWHDCAADLDRRHPSLPLAPSAAPDSVVFAPPYEPVDTIVPDTIPDLEPDPEPPDAAVWFVAPPDTVGSATTYETLPSGAVRIVMGPGGQTFVRWFVTMPPGIWRLTVQHEGVGGGVLWGAETFVLSEGAATDVYYRSVAEQTNTVLEVDNLNAPMDRTIRRFELEQTELSEAVSAEMVPASVDLAVGDAAQLCAIAIMPTGQAILDAVQVAIPECQAALAAYREGQL